MISLAGIPLLAVVTLLWHVVKGSGGFEFKRKVCVCQVQWMASVLPSAQSPLRVFEHNTWLAMIVIITALSIPTT